MKPGRLDKLPSCSTGSLESSLFVRTKIAYV
jgi:hypothetical protein